MRCMMLPQIVVPIAEIGEQSDATMARTRADVGDVHHRPASAGRQLVVGAVWRDGLASTPTKEKRSAIGSGARNIQLHVDHPGLGGSRGSTPTPSADPLESVASDQRPLIPRRPDRTGPVRLGC